MTTNSQRSGSGQASIGRSAVKTPLSLGDQWGYARALRVGDRVEVSGTAAWDGAGAYAPHSAYEQARRALGIICEALAELGATPADVVRTRAYLRDVTDWPEVARAHLEIFGAIEPVSTCVGGLQLMHPDLRVEFEASAVVTG